MITAGLSPEKNAVGGGLRCARTPKIAVGGIIRRDLSRRRRMRLRSGIADADGRGSPFFMHKSAIIKQIERSARCLAAAAMLLFAASADAVTVGFDAYLKGLTPDENGVYQVAPGEVLEYRLAVDLNATQWDAIERGEQLGDTAPIAAEISTYTISLFAIETLNLQFARDMAPLLVDAAVGPSPSAGMSVVEVFNADILSLDPSGRYVRWAYYIPSLRRLGLSDWGRDAGVGYGDNPAVQLEVHRDGAAAGDLQMPNAADEIRLNRIVIYGVRIPLRLNLPADALETEISIAASLSNVRFRQPAESLGEAIANVRFERGKADLQGAPEISFRVQAPRLHSVALNGATSSTLNLSQSLINEAVVTTLTLTAADQFGRAFAPDAVVLSYEADNGAVVGITRGVAGTNVLSVSLSIAPDEDRDTLVKLTAAAEGATAVAFIAVDAVDRVAASLELTAPPGPITQSAVGAEVSATFTLSVVDNYGGRGRVSAQVLLEALFDDALVPLQAPSAIAVSTAVVEVPVSLRPRPGVGGLLELSARLDGVETANASVSVVAASADALASLRFEQSFAAIDEDAQGDFEVCVTLELTGVAALDATIVATVRADTALSAALAADDYTLPAMPTVVFAESTMARRGCLSMGISDDAVAEPAENLYLLLSAAFDGDTSTTLFVSDAPLTLQITDADFITVRVETSATNVIAEQRDARRVAAHIRVSLWDGENQTPFYDDLGGQTVFRFELAGGATLGDLLCADDLGALAGAAQDICLRAAPGAAYRLNVGASNDVLELEYDRDGAREFVIEVIAPRDGRFEGRETTTLRSDDGLNPAPNNPAYILPGFDTPAADTHYLHINRFRVIVPLSLHVEDAERAVLRVYDDRGLARSALSVVEGGSEIYGLRLDDADSGEALIFDSARDLQARLTVSGAETVFEMLLVASADDTSASVAAPFAAGVVEVQFALDATGAVDDNNNVSEMGSLDIMLQGALAATVRDATQTLAVTIVEPLVADLLLDGSRDDVHLNLPQEAVRQPVEAVFALSGFDQYGQALDMREAIITATATAEAEVRIRIDYNADASAATLVVAITPLEDADTVASLAIRLAGAAIAATIAVDAVDRELAVFELEPPAEISRQSAVGAVVTLPFRLSLLDNYGEPMLFSNAFSLSFTSAVDEERPPDPNEANALALQPVHGHVTNQRVTPPPGRDVTLTVAAWMYLSGVVSTLVATDTVSVRVRAAPVATRFWLDGEVADGFHRALTQDAVAQPVTAVFRLTARDQDDLPISLAEVSAAVVATAGAEASAAPLALSADGLSATLTLTIRPFADADTTATLSIISAAVTRTATLAVDAVDRVVARLELRSLIEPRQAEPGEPTTALFELRAVDNYEDGVAIEAGRIAFAVSVTPTGAARATTPASVALPARGATITLTIDELNEAIVRLRLTATLDALRAETEVDVIAAQPRQPESLRLSAEERVLMLSTVGDPLPIVIKLQALDQYKDAIAVPGSLHVTLQAEAIAGSLTIDLPEVPMSIAADGASLALQVTLRQVRDTRFAVRAEGFVGEAPLQADMLFLETRHQAAIAQTLALSAAEATVRQALPEEIVTARFSVSLADSYGRTLDVSAARISIEAFENASGETLAATLTATYDDAGGDLRVAVRLSGNDATLRVLVEFDRFGADPLVETIDVDLVAAEARRVDTARVAGPTMLRQTRLRAPVAATFSLTARDQYGDPIAFDSSAVDVIADGGGARVQARVVTASDVFAATLQLWITPDEDADAHVTLSAIVDGVRASAHAFMVDAVAREHERLVWAAISSGTDLQQRRNDESVALRFALRALDNYGDDDRLPPVVVTLRAESSDPQVTPVAPMSVETTIAVIVVGVSLTPVMGRDVTLTLTASLAGVADASLSARVLAEPSRLAEALLDGEAAPMRMLTQEVLRSTLTTRFALSARDQYGVAQSVRGATTRISVDSEATVRAFLDFAPDGMTATLTLTIRPDASSDTVARVSVLIGEIAAVASISVDAVDRVIDVFDLAPPAVVPRQARVGDSVELRFTVILLDNYGDEIPQNFLSTQYQIGFLANTDGSEFPTLHDANALVVNAYHGIGASWRVTPAAARDTTLTVRAVLIDGVRDTSSSVDVAVRVRAAPVATRFLLDAEEADGFHRELRQDAVRQPLTVALDVSAFDQDGAPIALADVTATAVATAGAEVLLSPPAFGVNLFSQRLFLTITPADDADTTVTLSIASAAVVDIATFAVDAVDRAAALLRLRAVGEVRSPSEPDDEVRAVFTLSAEDNYGEALAAEAGRVVLDVQTVPSGALRATLPPPIALPAQGATFTLTLSEFNGEDARLRLTATLGEARDSAEIEVAVAHTRRPAQVSLVALGAEVVQPMADAIVTATFIIAIDDNYGNSGSLATTVTLVSEVSVGEAAMHPAEFFVPVGGAEVPVLLRPSPGVDVTLTLRASLNGVPDVEAQALIRAAAPEGALVVRFASSDLKVNENGVASIDDLMVEPANPPSPTGTAIIVELEIVDADTTAVEGEDFEFIGATATATLTMRIEPGRSVADAFEVRIIADRIAENTEELHLRIAAVRFESGASEPLLHVAEGLKRILIADDDAVVVRVEALAARMPERRLRDGRISASGELLVSLWDADNQNPFYDRRGGVGVISLELADGDAAGFVALCPQPLLIGDADFCLRPGADAVVVSQPSSGVQRYDFEYRRDGVHSWSIEVVAPADAVIEGDETAALVIGAGFGADPLYMLPGQTPPGARYLSQSSVSQTFAITDDGQAYAALLDESGAEVSAIVTMEDSVAGYRFEVRDKADRLPRRLAGALSLRLTLVDLPNHVYFGGYSSPTRSISVEIAAGESSSTRFAIVAELDDNRLPEEGRLSIDAVATRGAPDVVAAVFVTVNDNELPPTPTTLLLNGSTETLSAALVQSELRQPVSLDLNFTLLSQYGTALEVGELLIDIAATAAAVATATRALSADGLTLTLTLTIRPEADADAVVSLTARSFGIGRVINEVMAIISVDAVDRVASELNLAVDGDTAQNAVGEAVVIGLTFGLRDNYGDALPATTLTLSVVSSDGRTPTYEPILRLPPEGLRTTVSLAPMNGMDATLAIAARAAGLEATTEVRLIALPPALSALIWEGLTTRTLTLRQSELRAEVTTTLTLAARDQYGNALDLAAFEVSLLSMEDTGAAVMVASTLSADGETLLVALSITPNEDIDALASLSAAAGDVSATAIIAVDAVDRRLVSLTLASPGTLTQTLPEDEVVAVFALGAEDNYGAEAAITTGSFNFEVAVVPAGAALVATPEVARVSTTRREVRVRMARLDGRDFTLLLDVRLGLPDRRELSVLADARVEAAQPRRAEALLFEAEEQVFELSQALTPLSVPARLRMLDQYGAPFAADNVTVTTRFDRLSSTFARVVLDNPPTAIAAEGTTINLAIELSAVGNSLSRVFVAVTTSEGRTFEQSLLFETRSDAPVPMTLTLTAAQTQVAQSRPGAEVEVEFILTLLDSYGRALDARAHGLDLTETLDNGAAVTSSMAIYVDDELRLRYGVTLAGESDATFTLRAEAVADSTLSDTAQVTLIAAVPRLAEVLLNDRPSLNLSLAQRVLRAPVVVTLTLTARSQYTDAWDVGALAIVVSPAGNAAVESQVIFDATTSARVVLTITPDEDRDAQVTLTAGAAGVAATATIAVDAVDRVASELTLAVDGDGVQTAPGEPVVIGLTFGLRDNYGDTGALPTSTLTLNVVSSDGQTPTYQRTLTLPPEGARTEVSLAPMNGMDATLAIAARAAGAEATTEVRLIALPPMLSALIWEGLTTRTLSLRQSELRAAVTTTLSLLARDQYGNALDVAGLVLSPFGVVESSGAAVRITSTLSADGSALLVRLSITPDEDNDALLALSVAASGLTATALIAVDALDRAPVSVSLLPAMGMRVLQQRARGAPTTATFVFTAFDNYGDILPEGASNPLLDTLRIRTRYTLSDAMLQPPATSPTRLVGERSFEIAVAPRPGVDLSVALEVTVFSLSLPFAELSDRAEVEVRAAPAPGAADALFLGDELGRAQFEVARLSATAVQPGVLRLTAFSRGAANRYDAAVSFESSVTRGVGDVRLTPVSLAGVAQDGELIRVEILPASEAPMEIQIVAVSAEGLRATATLFVPRAPAVLSRLLLDGEETQSLALAQDALGQTLSASWRLSARDQYGEAFSLAAVVLDVTATADAIAEAMLTLSADALSATLRLTITPDGDRDSEARLTARVGEVSATASVRVDAVARMSLGVLAVRPLIAEHSQTALNAEVAVAFEIGIADNYGGLLAPAQATALTLTLSSRPALPAGRLRLERTTLLLRDTTVVRVTATPLPGEDIALILAATSAELGSAQGEALVRASPAPAPSVLLLNGESALALTLAQTRLRAPVVATLTLTARDQYGEAIAFDPSAVAASADATAGAAAIVAVAAAAATSVMAVDVVARITPLEDADTTATLHVAIGAAATSATIAVDALDRALAADIDLIAPTSPLRQSAPEAPTTATFVFRAYDNYGDVFDDSLRDALVDSLSIAYQFTYSDPTIAVGSSRTAAFVGERVFEDAVTAKAGVDVVVRWRWWSNPTPCRSPSCAPKPRWRFWRRRPSAWPTSCVSPTSRGAPASKSRGCRRR